MTETPGLMYLKFGRRLLLSDSAIWIPTAEEMAQYKEAVKEKHSMLDGDWCSMNGFKLVLECMFWHWFRWYNSYVLLQCSRITRIWQQNCLDGWFIWKIESSLWRIWRMLCSFLNCFDSTFCSDEMNIYKVTQHFKYLGRILVDDTDNKNARYIYVKHSMDTGFVIFMKPHGSSQEVN